MLSANALSTTANSCMDVRFRFLAAKHRARARKTLLTELVHRRRHLFRFALPAESQPVAATGASASVRYRAIFSGASSGGAGLCDLIPPCRLFLDIFAGSTSPVSAAIASLGKAIDKLAGSACDLLDDTIFSNLCRLCASRLVGAAGAALTRRHLAKLGVPYPAARVFLQEAVSLPEAVSLWRPFPTRGCSPRAECRSGAEFLGGVRRVSE